MRLILVRHGEADPDRSGIDSQRYLTAKGHQQAQKTAEFIHANYKPDLFVVSPYIRAQQTLSHLQALCPDVPTQVYQDITPDDSAAFAVNWLSQLTEETIVVVCHMNIVAYMAAILTQDSPEIFDLAEARVYEHPVIMVGLSEEKARFIPTVN